MKIQSNEKVNLNETHRGEDGFWLAECPNLPGCISQGKSKKNAIQNIREAIEGYLEVLQEDDQH